MKRTIALSAATLAARNIFLFNAAFLTLMSFFRAAFFFYFANFSALGGLTADIAKAFWMGARYDLVVVAYISAPITLSLIAVWSAGRVRVFEAWAAAVRYYYLVFCSLALFFLFVDFGFYSYFQNHINAMFFGFFEDDTLALVKTIAKDRAVYPALALFAALVWVINFSSVKLKNALAAAAGSCAPPLFSGASVFGRASRGILFVITLLAVNILAARGSLAMMPLGTVNAEISTDIFVNKLAINAFFTFQEALDARIQQMKNAYDVVALAGYAGDIERAFSDFLGCPREKLSKDLMSNLAVRTPRNPAAEKIRPNVVLIMMEGFGSHLALHDSADFATLGGLKKHFAEDYVFWNFLPAHTGTIDSLETVLLNIPKRPDTKAISQTRYGWSSFPTGAALPFKRAGYATEFLYGGNAGWRNLSAFVALQGFEVVEGEGAMGGDIPKNEWGIYDEFLFGRILEKLSSRGGRPVFIFALTTTNHPPYSVPPSYKPLPLSLPPELDAMIAGNRALAAKRFLTYQYANDKLGEFIAKIKNSPLGRNTVIAVTGDHNFWDVFGYSREESLDMLGVPFYVYVPPALRPSRARPEKYGSHLDIMATLYTLALSGAEYYSLGRSMFAAGGGAGFISDGFLISEKGASFWNVRSGASSFFTWSRVAPRRIVSSEKKDFHEEQLKKYKSSLSLAEYILRTSGRSGADARAFKQ